MYSYTIGLLSLSSIFLLLILLVRGLQGKNYSADRLDNVTGSPRANKPSGLRLEVDHASNGMLSAGIIGVISIDRLIVK